MSVLRSSNGEHLLLLGAMDGDRAEEKRIHGLFDKKQGEWFHPTPPLLEFIRLNCDLSCGDIYPHDQLLPDLYE